MAVTTRQESDRMVSAFQHLRRPLDAPPLTNEQLRAVAPSIFAPERCETKTSERFHYIQTSGVIDLLRKEGWEPATAVQSGTRQKEREGFQKHMVRFRNANLNRQLATDLKGDVIPELIATNAHDGTGAYCIMAGLFVVACMNGHITYDSTLDVVRIRHFGYTDQDVIEATHKISEAVPRALNSMKVMQATQLTHDQRLDFAEKAVSIRWPHKITVPVAPLNVLAPRRPKDVGDDLWRTFNVTQENLMQGGLVTGMPKKPNGKPRTTREIRNIPEVVRVNKQLWGLAQSFLR